MDICKRTAPPTVTVAPGHSAACWLHVDNGEHHSDVAMAPSTPVVALTGESEVQRPP
jgi:hypothetical protein